MRVIIRQKNLEITPALRDYVEKKIIAPVQKLVRNIRLPDLPLLNLQIMRTTEHHRKGNVYKVSARLALNGKTIHAEAEDENVHAAADGVREELRRGISVYKNRMIAVFKRGARRAKKELRFDRAARFFRTGRIRDEGN